MRMDNLSGYFDVRKYSAEKAQNERAYKSADSMVTFGVAFDPEHLPKELANRAKAVQRKKDGSTYMLVKFKVGKGCKWFEKQGGRVKEIARPANAELDGKRYDVCIDFRELNGDPTKQEACGYWVNAILIAEAESNYFADLNENEQEIEQEKEVPVFDGSKNPQDGNIDSGYTDEKLPF